MEKKCEKDRYDDRKSERLMYLQYVVVFHIFWRQSKIEFNSAVDMETKFESRKENIWFLNKNKHAVLLVN